MNSQVQATNHVSVRRHDAVGRIAFGWTVTIIGTLTALALRDHFVPWVWMWLTIGMLFWTLKLLTILNLDNREAFPGGRLAAYLFLWPGMRPEPFLNSAQATGRKEAYSWTWGTLNLFSGAVLLWSSPQRFLEPWDLWLSMIGFSLTLHFGLFDLLAAFWRWRGVPVEKLFCNPIAATSLADFWNNRWNRAFSAFVRDLLFRPLARRIGGRFASLAVFAFSGLVHELAISVPARGGYGGPMLYFLIQGVLMQMESTALGRTIIRKVPVLGWLWTMIAVLGPMPLLFHGPFIGYVVVPFLTAIGVSGIGG